ncbi:hypothetical protein FRC05_009288 [Tulasnella sp. 425]|nr:hypothetical protein FRC05_009288 [Tulasnella sp. 425]
MRVVSPLQPSTSAPTPTRPKFDVDLLKSYMKKLISTTLEKERWDSKDKDKQRAWCKEISERVKGRMLEIQPKGFKFIVTTIINENLGQGGRADMASHWEDCDTVAQEMWANSGSLSLEIAIDLRWWSPLADILDQVIDALLPHKDRWASFALQTNSDDGVMAGILVRISEELPELRELVLQCPEGWRISRFPRPLICPKLQVLRLQGMAPQHNALVVSALPSLASVSIADTSLRWSDWSTLLQHGPKLVELVLRNVDIGRAGDLGNVPPVSMPHLERFALRLKTGRSGPTGTALLDPVVASFFAPKLHTLLVNVTGAGTAPPPNHTWQEAMPMLKTLVIQTEGDIDASVFQRCPHISHISVSDSRLEGHPLARRILEHLADPSTGPLLDQLDTLTLLAMIPTYEGWEKFLSGKKLRVCIDPVFEIATRKSMDTKNLQDREAAIEKLKAIVPVEICPIPKDNTWFSNRWRFGGDD